MEKRGTIGIGDKVKKFLCIFIILITLIKNNKV